MPSSSRRPGRLSLTRAVAFTLFAVLSAGPPLPTSMPVTSATQGPALQGDAAWMELERRGEKAALLAALDAARYDARAVDAAPNTVAVENPAQSIRATFAPDEVRLRAGASAMRLRAIGVGYGDTLQPITHVVTRTAGARVEIDRTLHLTEWWVNRAVGLEQGYTVRDAPDGRVDGAWLRVVMAVDGDLMPRVAADGQSATFAEADGTTRLLYDHLVAFDATGRLLPARMRIDGALLSLETNDTRAVYPVTIDPTFTAPDYLKASNTGATDLFGNSVAVSGDTVVVGAQYEDGSGIGVDPASNESATNAGAAYVFVRSGATWSPQAYLKASNTGMNDWFGSSVAVSGDTVVVGAMFEDGSGTGVNPASNDNAADAGAAYVFVRNGTTWSQQAYLKASNTGGSDSFGASVGVSGDTAVVGAPSENGSGTGVDPVSNESANSSGAAYVFVRNGTTWSPQAYLKASNTGVGDQFGASLAVSGDTVVVGAQYEDGSNTGVNPVSNENASAAGAAYVFVRSGTTWSPQAYLKASNTGGTDQFGASVAVSGDMVVAGARLEDGSGTGVNPASNELAGGSGAAYVFIRSGTTWNPPTYLKASNTGGTDSFGSSVAVSGDTVVIGAFSEDGSGTGVNPASNELAGGSGAAYVFVWTGTDWSPQAYLKASNTGANDAFGVSAAVSSGTIVVGAMFENGSGTGVNPPSDELGGGPGAAYVFAGMPGAFGKALPIDGATNQSTSPTLSWGASTGAASYDYCIDTTNDSACSAWTSTGTDTSVSLTGLAAGTTHYWHVRAIDGMGTTYAEGNITAFWSFTTGVSAPAFGQVDTPVQNAAGVQGAIGVTGWALDDVSVTTVEIFRNCLAFEPQVHCQTVLGHSVVYIGEAAFVPGARPDVEAAYPTYPNKDRAGWGYLLLTPMLPDVDNSLPHGGQGALTLYAVATDSVGNKTLLGRSSDAQSPDFATPTAITMTNATIAKPFGAIDTPGQGQTISGLFNNFGWALTPDSNTTSGDPEDIFIPTNGSTMVVFIDALPVALVAYNQCRGDVGNPVPAGVYCNDDVANIFGNVAAQPALTPRTSNPTQFRNLDIERAAIGAYTIDTSALSNGLHTIAWSVTDSEGRLDGIGSRYFTVLNAGAIASSEAERQAAHGREQGEASDVSGAAPATEGVFGRTGFDLAAAWKTMRAKRDGMFAVRLPEMGRLELWLGAPVDTGYLVANGTLRSLPIGASLSGSRFGWMPPPGYVGPYHLVFVRGRERINVTVTVVPTSRVVEGEAQIRMHLDPVRTESRVRGAAHASNERAVRVEGWAFDPQAAIGSGIGAVHVWAKGRGEAAPLFLGEATLDEARFSLTASLAPGTYDLTAYVWNERTARWEDARSRTVTVK